MKNLVKLVTCIMVITLLVSMFPVAYATDTNYVTFRGLSHWILSNNGRIVGEKSHDEANTELLDYQKTSVSIPSFLRAKGKAKVMIVDGYSQSGILAKGFSILNCTFHIREDKMDEVSALAIQRVSKICGISEERVEINQDTFSIASMHYDGTYGKHHIFSSDECKEEVGFVEFIDGRTKPVYMGLSGDNISEKILGYVAASGPEVIQQPKQKAVSNIWLYDMNGLSNWLIARNGRIIGRTSPCEDVEELGYEQHPEFKYPHDILENGPVRYQGKSLICLDNSSIGWTQFCVGIEIDIVWAELVQDIVKYYGSVMALDASETIEFNAINTIASTVYVDRNDMNENEEAHASHIFFKSSEWRECVGYVYFDDGSKAELYVGDFDKDGKFELGFKPGFYVNKPEPKSEPEKPSKPCKPCEEEPCTPCNKKHCITIKFCFQLKICY